MLILAVLAASFGAALSYAVYRFAPLADRWLAVHERTHAPLVNTAKSEPMPAHLVQAASAQDSEWARDDVLSAMRESYAELGDWTLVASRFHGMMQ